MNPTNSSIAAEFRLASVDLLQQSMVKIRHCLDQLNETQVWWRPEPCMNSVGNLCVHVAGNLRQWGVVPFSDADDERQREKEFSTELTIPSRELLNLLQECTAEAEQLWSNLSTRELLKPKTIQGFNVSGLQAISHTSSHFVGHTHQIISLTRIQLGSDYGFHWTPENRSDDLPI